MCCGWIGASRLWGVACSELIATPGDSRSWGHFVQSDPEPIPHNRQHMAEDDEEQQFLQRRQPAGRSSTCHSERRWISWTSRLRRISHAAVTARPESRGPGGARGQRSGDRSGRNRTRRRLNTAPYLTFTRWALPIPLLLPSRRNALARATTYNIHSSLPHTLAWLHRLSPARP